jgi:hypothetical protein
MIFSDGAPVAMGEEVRIIAWFAIDVIGKHGNHILICLVIEMVNFVSPV